MKNETMAVKVSVIIPVYGVEAFIARCADSLLAQTLGDVEFIFVDDATPDRSMELLSAAVDRYPSRREAVRILRHLENRGLPAARNTGLAAARGEYVFHCDSDDFVEPDMLERLYAAAQEKDADIVWCDWYLSFRQSERYMKQPDYDNPTDALKAMLAGQMKFNVWNKLVRRRLYADHGIDFPAGHSMGEDMTMMLLFAVAARVAYVPGAFYHYVKLNAGAFSQHYTREHMAAVAYNISRVASALEARYGHALDLEIACMKLEAKFPFLMSADRADYRVWQEYYGEANAYIRANRYISARRRWVQRFAAKGWWGLVRLHYWLVDRLVYGLIYK